MAAEPADRTVAAAHVAVAEAAAAVAEAAEAADIRVARTKSSPQKSKAFQAS